MDEPIRGGQAHRIRIAHAPMNTVCMETGTTIERADICVKMWGHSTKTRNGRSVKFLSLNGVNALQERLEHGGPEAAKCPTSDAFTPEDDRVPPKAGCAVCLDRPTYNDMPSEPVNIYRFGNRMRYPWIHADCMGEFADILNEVWSYSDVALQHTL